MCVDFCNLSCKSHFSTKVNNNELKGGAPVQAEARPKRVRSRTTRFDDELLSQFEEKKTKVGCKRRSDAYKAFDRFAATQPRKPLRVEKLPTVHYWGPGRTWKKSFAYHSIKDLKKSLIEKTMKFRIDQCRYTEADRIEANARQALADGYFEQNDFERMFAICEEARKPPGIDEVPYLIAKWTEEGEEAKVTYNYARTSNACAKDDRSKIFSDQEVKELKKRAEWLSDHRSAPRQAPCGYHMGREEGHKCQGPSRM